MECELSIRSALGLTPFSRSLVKLRRLAGLHTSRWEGCEFVEGESECGYHWGKLDLSVRQMKCLDFGAIHDRDENAAKNIDQSGLELAQDNNWIGSKCKTPVVAVCDELSTHLVDEHGQMLLFAS